MRKNIVISINPKLAIGAGLAALLIAGFGCSFFDDEDSPAPEDIVRVSTAADKLPELGKLLPEDVTGVLLIRKGKNESESPIITPLTRDGEPKNLCGSSDSECELVTSPDALLRMVGTIANAASITLRMLSTSPNTSTASTTTTDSPGTCKVRDRRYDCHKTGIHKNKRNWHQSPDTAIHRQCGSIEGCI